MVVLVPINVQLCPEDRYDIKCPYKRTPTRIVVHNTGNDAPAKNEVTYMINRPEEISFHVAVDDREIRQAIPFDRNCWASGDGCGTGNMYGIHIEICYSLNGGPKFMTAERNAAEYIASLLLKYGWNLDQVTKHQDYDGKYCPHRTLDMGWERFKVLVGHYYDELLKEDEIVTYEEWMKHYERHEKEVAAKKVSGWAEKDWDVFVDAGIFDGTQPRGPLTREQAAAVFSRLGLKPSKD